MKRLLEVLAVHGEALIFALAIVMTFTVIIPTMDAHDEARHTAHVAQK